MTQRTKIVTTAVAFITVLAPSVSKADLFGGDLVFLAQLVEQGIQTINKAEQLYQTEEQARRNVENMANFFRNPAQWRQAATLASQMTAMQLSRTGHADDARALESLSSSIQFATESLQGGIQGTELSTGNAASIALLQLQQIDSLLKRDQIQSRLDYLSKVNAYQSQGVGELGDVWGSLKGRILK